MGGREKRRGKGRGIEEKRERGEVGGEWKGREAGEREEVFV